MRARTTLVAALLAGISFACSKPAPTNTYTPDASTPANDREIRLVDAPISDVPVVSALEAGLPAGLSAGRSSARAAGQSRMVAAAAAPKAEEMEPGADAASPSLALTEMRAPAAVVAPTTVLPGAHGLAAATRGEGSATAPSRGTRGPVILIRGGMGAPDDDCKLHPVASRGVGIAINNVAPIPGRAIVDNRFPRGNGGFTRIR